MFDLPSCQQLYTFQRGSTPVSIYSMSFNCQVSQLAVSSSKGTIHIFHLANKDRRSTNDNEVNSTSSSRWDTKLTRGFRKVLKSFSSSITQTAVGTTHEITRSFVRIKVKADKFGGSILYNMISLSNSYQYSEEDGTLLICLENGNLLQYAIGRNGRYQPVRAEDMMFDG